MRQTIKAMTGDTRGATAIEYAIITAFIALVVIASANTLGFQVQAMFASIVF